MAGHRENLAVVRIERDNRAGVITQRLLRHLLEIKVDSQHQALPGTVGNFLERAQAPADRIDFDLLPAADAAQKGLESALQSELADLVAHMVAGEPGEILLIGFANVAQQMRCEIAVQVMAPRRDLQADPRKLELMGLDRDHLRPGQPLLDCDRIIFRAPFVFGPRDRVRDMAVAQQLLEPLLAGGEILGVLGHHHRVEGRTRVDQRAMAPIEDDPARRRHPERADPVAIGQRGQLLALDDLKIIEAGRQHRQRHHHERKQRDETGFKLRYGVAFAATEKPSQGRGLYKSVYSRARANPSVDLPALRSQNAAGASDGMFQDGQRSG